MCKSSSSTSGMAGLVVLDKPVVLIIVIPASLLLFEAVELIFSSIICLPIMSYTVLISSRTLAENTPMCFCSIPFERRSLSEIRVIRGSYMTEGSSSRSM